MSNPNGLYLKHLQVLAQEMYANKFWVFSSSDAIHWRTPVSTEKRDQSYSPRPRTRWLRLASSAPPKAFLRQNQRYSTAGTWSANCAYIDYHLALLPKFFRGSSKLLLVFDRVTLYMNWEILASDTAPCPYLCITSQYQSIISRSGFFVMLRLMPIVALHTPLLDILGLNYSTWPSPAFP